jgi:hypothetical protein
LREGEFAESSANENVRVLTHSFAQIAAGGFTPFSLIETAAEVILTCQDQTGIRLAVFVSKPKTTQSRQRQDA